MRYFLYLIALASLSACAPKDYFRNNISSTPCTSSENNDCATANLLVNEQEGYTLGFVEMDDQGQFFNQQQANALLTQLAEEERPQYVVIFTHGWHHNASENDFNVQRFKKSLRDIKQLNPDYQITGIYVGWRGETLALPWLRTLTYWDRQAVSAKIGQDDLQEFLLQVESVVKSQSETAAENKLLTMGHSLGAAIIFNALKPTLMARLTAEAGELPRSGFGDLVVLLNPAFEARNFVALRLAAQSYDQLHAFGEQQNPLLVIASSEADTLTRNPFTWAQTIPALFEFPLLTENNKALSGISNWDLGTVAIGHFQPFITHHLRFNTTGDAQAGCDADEEWLDNAILQQKGYQLEHEQSATGEGWQSVSDCLQLEHLGRSSAYNPYWVVQIDKSILPGHGFFTDKLFWSFMNQLLGVR